VFLEQPISRDVRERQVRRFSRVGATVEVATTSASTLNFEGLGQDRPQRPTGKHLLRLIFSTGQEIVPQPYTGSGFFRSPYGPARSRKLHSRAQVEAGEGGGAGARREGRPGWQRCTVCRKLLVVICCGTTVADPDGKDGDKQVAERNRLFVTQHTTRVALVFIHVSTSIAAQTVAPNN
jgi:hypothetical protein